MRADLALVERRLAPSRSAARRLIEAGAVFAIASAAKGGNPPAASGLTRRRVERPATEVDDNVELLVESSDETRFVSRAGAKLEGAMRSRGLDPRAMTVLDLGTSTGGFADCLLQAGCARVVGIEVGHGQLHPRLAGHPRLQLFEGMNARSLQAVQLGAAMPTAGFDLIVADLSFISLTKVLPAALPLAAGAPRGRLLALVKPQFELGPQALDSRGVVRDPALYDELLPRMSDCLQQHGWHVDAFIDSHLPGGDGNREFFIDASP